MSYHELCVSLLLTGSCFGAETIQASENSLIAHEWGTFTSVAGTGRQFHSVDGSRRSGRPAVLRDPSSQLTQIADLRDGADGDPGRLLLQPRPMTLRSRLISKTAVLTEWYPDATHAASGGSSGRTSSSGLARTLDLPTGRRRQPLLCRARNGRSAVPSRETAGEAAVLSWRRRF